ncbi:MAG TPA: acetylglutamate kinase [Gemmatimonadaceae bacterium]|nr:acetylglutamate kinase [Gemmatimonadaceae bacterium]
MQVIKIGGRPQSDPAFPEALARAWRDSACQIVLVHGGGDEVSSLQAALGAAPTFVDGRRVTSARDAEIVRLGLSGSANKRLASALLDAGVPALGISGEDAALITAVPLDAARLGHVGTPHRINVDLLRHLIGGGYLPVISPVSRNAAAAPANAELGRTLNVNGDDAASAIAVALAASELLLVADVPGVMSDGALVSRVDVRGARRMLADGTAAGGMRAKLQAALAALEGGVERVRIGAIGAIGHPERGTTLLR